MRGLPSDRLLAKISFATDVCTYDRTYSIWMHMIHTYVSYRMYDMYCTYGRLRWFWIDVTSGTCLSLFCQVMNPFVRGFHAALRQEVYQPSEDVSAQLLLFLIRANRTTNLFVFLCCTVPWRSFIAATIERLSPTFQGPKASTVRGGKCTQQNVVSLFSSDGPHAELSSFVSQDSRSSS